MTALNILAANDDPKATEHIDSMIQLISSLIEKGQPMKLTERVLSH